MNNDERNTHFQCFAALLWKELETTISEDEHFLYYFDGIQVEAIRRAIAQRAYDLVFHILDQSPYGCLNCGMGTPGEIREAIEGMPDMFTFPAKGR